MMARDETGTIRAIVGIAARDGANVLRTIQTAYARDNGGTRRAVFGSLSAPVTPSFMLASAYSPSSAQPFTPFCTVAPTGGTAPYTYSWSVDSGWGVLNPTSATTSFQSVGISPGDSSDATGTVVVTDANGLTANGLVTLNSFNSYF